MPLELAPARDIGTLKPGDELELKVYFKGKPYTGQGSWSATYAGYSTEAEDNYYPETTVSGDTFRVPVSHPGSWFVRYSIKIDATGKDTETYDQTKHTATLVFQIPNARKRGDSENH